MYAKELRSLGATSRCMYCAETMAFLLQKPVQTMQRRALLPVEAKHFEQGHVVGLAQCPCMQPSSYFTSTNHRMCSVTHSGNLKTTAEALRHQALHSYRTPWTYACWTTACWTEAKLSDRCTDSESNRAWTSSQSIPAIRTFIKHRLAA